MNETKLKKEVRKGLKDAVPHIIEGVAGLFNSKDDKILSVSYEIKEFKLIIKVEKLDDL